MKADGYLINMETGVKLDAHTFYYGDPDDLDRDERLRCAEEAVEGLEPKDGVYLFVIVDFETAQLFCDRVAVESEVSWSVAPAV